MAFGLSVLRLALFVITWIFSWPIWIWLRATQLLIRQLQQCFLPLSPDDESLLQELKEASDYTTWLAAARRLDDSHPSPKTDVVPNRWTLRRAMQSVRFDDDIKFGWDLTGALERNVGGDARPEMFAQRYTGDSPALSDYVGVLVDKIDSFAKPKPGEDEWNGEEWKVNQLDSAGTVYGWTALVLQGGGAFALHHLGVMKALLQQGLLPNIIFGTSTGAWIAALLATLTDEEYLAAVDELTEHVLRSIKDGGQVLEPRMDWTALFALRRPSFRQKAYNYDKDVFAKYVLPRLSKTTTFQEAYEKTGRIVNIEIACDTPATPNLLNYITTPNIIISTAARAAQSDDFDIAPSFIWEKSDYDGQIHTWSLFDETPSFRNARQKYRQPRGSAHLTLASSRDDPMLRMVQIFNVKYFIISQPRPYIFPFVRSVYHNRAQRPRLFADTRAYIRRTIVSQWHFRMRQHATVSDIAYRTQQLLLEDRAHSITITLAPDATFEDMEKMVHEPSKEVVEKCVLAGERSVWECLPALHVSMDVEAALEKYHRFKMD